jgi:hypothetical protein
MMKRSSAVGIAAFIAFAFCQIAPALAYGPYGPYEEFGGRNSVNAMVYFHLPLGASKAEQDHTASLGFTLKNDFQFAHPAYQRERGPYATSTTFDLLGLRFGMNGKLSGLDVAGLDALGAKARLSTITDASSGPN